MRPGEGDVGAAQRPGPVARLASGGDHRADEALAEPVEADRGQLAEQARKVAEVVLRRRMRDANPRAAARR